MVNCSILNCKSRSERKMDNITFHTFPIEPNLRLAWASVTGREDWIPTKYSRVCSMHFEDNCFQKTKKLTTLQSGSIPTLFVHEPVVEALLSTSETESVESGPDLEMNQVLPFSSTKPMPRSEYSFMGQINVLPSTAKTLMPESEHTTVKINYFYKQEQNNILPPDVLPTSKIHKVDLDDNTTLTPRKKNLTAVLQRKSFLAESRKRKIAELRSKTWRLQKKNAELTKIIQNLQSNNH